MKKIISLTTAIVFALVAANVQAQTLKTPAPSPTQTLKQAFALGDVTIEYSRPSAKGRVVYGDVVPFGKIWRTGANGPTKITFTEKMKVEGKEVAAGTYALYSIPNKDSWEVMLYSDLKLGGDVTNYDAAKEVARVTIKPTKLTEKVESFTINMDNLRDSTATITLDWENTRVSINITAAINDAIMANITKAVIEDNRPYFAAARYYYEQNKDLPKAHEWATKAFEQNTSAFWVKMLIARIELKMGKKKEAIASAEMTKKIAGEAKNDDYVKQANDLIKEASM